MSHVLKQHHGTITCQSHQGADERFSIEVYSGLRGFNEDKPAITLRIDFPGLLNTFSITPENARVLAARLIAAAHAGDGNTPVAMLWNHPVPPETNEQHPAHPTGLYHEPEAL